MYKIRQEYGMVQQESKHKKKEYCIHASVKYIRHTKMQSSIIPLENRIFKNNFVYRIQQ